MRNAIGSAVLLVFGAFAVAGGVLGLTGVLPGPVMLSVGALLGGIGLIQVVRQVNRRERDHELRKAGLRSN